LRKWTRGKRRAGGPLEFNLIYGSKDCPAFLTRFQYTEIKVCLKGQCHEMDIFLRSKLNFVISTFCVCAHGFQGLSKAFHYPIQLLTFYLRLWNYLLLLKMLTETLLRIPFSVIGRWPLMPTSHWLQGKWARINWSQAASGIILKNHRRLPVSIFSVKITA
jgi:hypothetical protein